ncbi:hypothetical protein ACTXPA_17555 [Glutamicibacter arilaitensis]|uniref:hypothetical protein n=1 Tax=Glutamicibacter arilaitensis TaxID=256701 RepID=UPI003FD682F7
MITTPSAHLATLVDKLAALHQAQPINCKQLAIAAGSLAIEFKNRNDTTSHHAALIIAAYAQAQTEQPQSHAWKACLTACTAALMNWDHFAPVRDRRSKILITTGVQAHELLTARKLKPTPPKRHTPRPLHNTTFAETLADYWETPTPLNDQQDTPTHSTVSAIKRAAFYQGPAAEQQLFGASPHWSHTGER